MDSQLSTNKWFWLASRLQHHRTPPPPPPPPPPHTHTPKVIPAEKITHVMYKFTRYPAPGDTVWRMYFYNVNHVKRIRFLYRSYSQTNLPATELTLRPLLYLKVSIWKLRFSPGATCTYSYLVSSHNWQNGSSIRGRNYQTRLPTSCARKSRIHRSEPRAGTQRLQSSVEDESPAPCCSSWLFITLRL